MISDKIGIELLKALGLPTQRVVNSELHLKAGHSPILLVEYLPEEKDLRKEIEKIVKKYRLVEIGETIIEKDA